MIPLSLALGSRVPRSIPLLCAQTPQPFAPVPTQDQAPHLLQRLYEALALRLGKGVGCEGRGPGVAAKEHCAGAGQGVQGQGGGAPAAARLAKQGPETRRSLRTGAARLPWRLLQHLLQLPA
jgi:hypothetical protein